MADFTPINTQEEMDKAIGPRLERERKTVAKEYEGRLSEKDKKIKELEDKNGTLSSQLEEADKKHKDFEAQIAERDGKIKGYESSAMKIKIAREVGLPYEAAERLAGEDEDAIRKDAESLKAIIGSGKPAPQRKSSEGNYGPDSEIEAGLKRTLDSMKGE